MRLGIEGSNIRFGGGLRHLVELLRAAQPLQYGFEQVLVWGGSSTLGLIEERPWLHMHHEPLLDRALPLRLSWQETMLQSLVKRAKCDVLFVPGSSYSGSFRPFVTMSQNLLPFEWSEAKRYGLSWTLLRLALLRHAQSRTFKAAHGLIFLTNYAKDTVIKVLPGLNNPSRIIPHGINRKFFLPPRHQKDIGYYSSEHPFRILYVSIIDVYKHQWNVAEAVAELKTEGFPVQLDLVGPAYPPALKKLNQVIKRIDPTGAFIHYREEISYSEILTFYHGADLFVFASTCETFGQILTEAMAGGLPIACSSYGTLAELLGSAAVYFDSEKPDEIADAIRELIVSPALRAQKAEEAYDRARTFTWERCAASTFDFLAEVCRNYRGDFS